MLNLLHKKCKLGGYVGGQMPKNANIICEGFLSNLDLRGFCFPQFFNVSPHQQCKLRNACLVIVKNHQIWVVKTSMSMTSKNIQVDNLYIFPFNSSIYQKLFYNANFSSLFSAALPNYICTSKNIGKKRP